MMGRGTGKTPQQMEYMREAGRVLVGVHAALRDAARPGISTIQLDQIAHDVTVAAGAKPNFLNYHGFPASVCISVNDQIVHGIPGSRVLEAGDIVSFDCGAVITRDGRTWHSDAAFTVVLDGPDADQNRLRHELSAMTEEAMWAGLAAAATARTTGDIGGAVEDAVADAAERYGWEPGILEGYSGHGIGTNLHEDPQVYNYRTRRKGPRIGPGSVLCIEPMLTEGDQASRVLSDDWTVVTLDGKASAHWEHTVAIGESGIAVLTAPDAGAKGLAPYGITPVQSFI